MVELFEGIERSDPSLGTRTESIFHFLDRIAGPNWQAVRQVMNEWFAKWPADAQPDLRARFRDDDPHQSIGAFWELYVHELFGRLGYQLERDPEVPGTTKRPDFLVSGAEESFYLEATIVGHSDEEKSTKRRRDIMLDLVDEARSRDFWVNIKVPVEGRETPRRNEVVRPIESWLAGLEWDEVQRSIVADPHSAPQFRLAVRDWVLTFRAYPWGEASRGNPDLRLIGMGPSWSGMPVEHAHIEADLKAKARRYGVLDKPFVIAALCIRDFADDRSIQQALYGPEVVRLAVPAAGPGAGVGNASLSRDPRGLWQYGQEQRATRVSAVLTALHINPWLMAQASLTLWKNPWAARPLTAELPFKTVTGDLQANRLTTTDALIEAREVLGLPEDWPSLVTD
jgi:hypothetical protein